MENITCIPLFAGRVSVQPDSNTIIILGTTRSGTSLVASAIRGFGYFLGENLLVNLEDQDFSYKTDQYIREVIQDRNENHKFWGWKFPIAIEHIDRILPFIRNPTFIIVTRDVTATACALTRWDEREASAALAETMMQGQKNLTMAIRHRFPTLYVSYEKISIDPDRFLTELEEFLSLPLIASREKVLRLMVPGAHKPDHAAVFAGDAEACEEEVFPLRG